MRDLATRFGLALVEVNFERDPTSKRHFASSDPRRILGELSLALGSDIRPEENLLFLDEIQSAPEALSRLRWFYEELPALRVIAAGSLLEFALTDASISVPVGRISFQQIEPLGFREYLEAHGQERLIGAIGAWRPGSDLSPAAHDQATLWFQRYAMVGGMPAVVAADVEGREPRALRDLQKELVAAYRADFAKYRGRMDQAVLDGTLRHVASSLGRKFVLARVGEGVKQHQAGRGLELLVMARLVHVVRYTAASGLPLGAEMKRSFRKAVLADVGLVHALVGTPAAQAFPAWESLAPALRGQLVDQLAAQELRLLDDGAGDGADLFYWQREGGRPGKIDYVIQLDGRIVPIELKSGAAGAMKSLHQFMLEKRLDLAVRCDANPPGIQDLSLKTNQGQPVSYRLVNLPLYLLWNLREVLAAVAMRGMRKGRESGGGAGEGTVTPPSPGTPA